MTSHLMKPSGQYQEWFVCLERHPDHTNRDPRRVWQYDCCSGKHSAVDYLHSHLFRAGLGGEIGDRVYYFENEHDMLMFSLRWQ